MGLFEDLVDVVGRRASDEQTVEECFAKLRGILEPHFRVQAIGGTVVNISKKLCEAGRERNSIMLAMIKDQNVLQITIVDPRTRDHTQALRITRKSWIAWQTMCHVLLQMLQEECLFDFASRADRSCPVPLVPHEEQPLLKVDEVVPADPGWRQITLREDES